MNYWLMKSEPCTFGIDHLMARPNQTEGWDGVRNYQARNMMRDDMKLGDKIFFYHSKCTPPGIAGVMKVVKESHPDVTALDPNSKYYDPKATAQNPRWFQVAVKFVQKFDQIITLEQLRQTQGLEDWALLQKGSRLSIMPVTKDQWDIIMSLTNT